MPATTERIETGPLQFGDDWPGVFIRCDNCGWTQENDEMYDMIESKQKDKE